MHRLMISAAHKSSGKTTLSVGLAAALRAQGDVVQTFKKGPDYIDPMWHGLASGRPCINLDGHLMHAAEIEAAVAQHAQGASIMLVEGNKGLFDGVSLDGSDSNAQLAKQLGLPVLLVIDARGMTRGIAPLLLGYQAFDKDVRIAGVILNQVGGPRHEAKLRAVIAQYTSIPVLGAVHKDERLSLTERHLGLMPAAELQDAQQRVQRMAEAVAAQVDLDAVRALAASAPAWAPVHASVDATLQVRPLAPAQPPVRIAIARDAAFGFYYPDDLAALEAAGATLLPFDTLHDAQLPPDIDGLFIGGGFPEAFLPALEANAALRSEIRLAIEAGLPSYAECGGLMYLARRIEWQGQSAEMVGAIPGDVTMHAKPVGRGYVRLAETGEGPWPPQPLDDGSLPVRLGHEFHHSSLDHLPAGTRFAYRVQRGHGVTGQFDGVCVHKLLASYSHLRHTGGNRWPERFVAFVRLEAAQRGHPSPRVTPRSTATSLQEPLPCSA